MASAQPEISYHFLLSVYLLLLTYTWQMGYRSFYFSRDVGEER